MPLANNYNSRNVCIKLRKEGNKGEINPQLSFTQIKKGDQYLIPFKKNIYDLFCHFHSYTFTVTRKLRRIHTLYGCYTVTKITIMIYY